MKTISIKTETNIGLFILDNYQELNRILKNIIFEFKNKYPESNTSNVNAWHSHYDTLHKEPRFNILTNKILEKSHEYFIKTNSLHLSLYPVNFWVMEYEKGNYTTKHNHHPAALSSVYYLSLIHI